MKKLLTVMLVIVIGLSTGVVFAGCSDPFDDEADGENTVKGKVTIQVAVLNEPGEKALMREFKREFEKINDKVNIKITYFPGTYQYSMSSYILKPSDMPDVLLVPGDQHAPFSSEKHFLDLKKFIDADEDVNLEDYYDSMLETTHYSDTDEGMWFAPRDYNKPVTFLNKAMFDAAGVEIPTQDEWNMDKFVEVCKELRVAMDNPNTTVAQKQAGLRPTSYPCDAQLNWNPIYHSLIGHYGGQLVDGKSINFKSAENKNAYESIYPLVRDRLITNPNTATMDMFLSKGAAMWFSVRPRLPGVVGANVDVDFLPMPTDTIGVGCSGYGISAKAAERVSTDLPGNTKPNSEYAWEFIKWIITEPGQEIFCASGSGVPVLKSMAESGAWLSYKSKDLNHKAFTSYPLRDIGLNVYNSFKPENQYNLLRYTDELFYSISKADTWAGSPVDTENTGTDYGNLNNMLDTLMGKITRYAV